MATKGQSQNSKPGQLNDDFVLENISGVSCVHKDALAANPSNGKIAFTASSLLVFQDPRYSQQTFMDNPSGRRIRAVNYSDDGKYLAYGEVGYAPYVVIYNTFEKRRVSKFQLPNRSTVKGIEFHPKSIYLAVMCLNDFTIGVFDLKGKKLARITFVVEPLGMTLPKVGSYLIVCGHRKVSLFSLMDIGSNVTQSNIVFERRSVLLGHQSDYTFVDITGGSGQHIKKVYTVTSCGYLCDLNVGDILIDRAAKIDNRCFCVKYSFGYAFVGCAKNTVKICSPANLSVVSIILDKDMFIATQFQPNIFKFEADTVAIAVNSSTKIVTCAFSDHHLHSWSVRCDDNFIECKPVRPVGTDGNEVVWQPTSYEIQEKVSKILSKVVAAKSSQASAESSNNQNMNLIETSKSSSSRVKPYLPTFYVNATRFTPDGKEIICGNAEGEIKILEVETGRLTRVIEAHTAAVTHIELLYDVHFRLMASGGRDRVIFILDADKNYGLVQVLGDHSSAIASISMAHYDGVLTLVSSAADGVILIRRAIKGKQLRFVIVGGIADIVGKPRIYAYATDFIITGGVNGHLKFFQTDPYVSTKPTRTIRNVTKGKNLMKSVAIDPSGIFLIANSASGTFVFNVHTGKHVATLSKIPGVSLLSFTDDCKYLISESNDGCRFMWRLPSKMSDAMKEKAAKELRHSGTIKFDKILSCISLYQDSPSGYVSAVNVIQPDPLEHGGQNESGASTDGSLQTIKGDQLGTFVSDQNSPESFESYSTCSTFSRSCIDITDCPQRSNMFQISEKSDVCCNIFREARRLLRNTGAKCTPHLDAIDDKNICFSTSSESSGFKKTSFRPCTSEHNGHIATASGLTNDDLSTKQELGAIPKQWSENDEKNTCTTSRTNLKTTEKEVCGIELDVKGRNSSGKQTYKSPSLTPYSSVTEYITGVSPNHDKAQGESSAGESRTTQESEIVSEVCENMTNQMMGIADKSDMFLSSRLALPLSLTSKGKMDETERTKEIKGRKWKTSSLFNFKRPSKCTNRVKRLTHNSDITEAGDVMNHESAEKLQSPDGAKIHVNTSDHNRFLQDVNQNTGNSVGLENDSTPASPMEELNFAYNSCNNYQTIRFKGGTKRHLKETITDGSHEHMLPERKIFQKIVRNNPRRLPQVLDTHGSAFKSQSDNRSALIYQDLLKVAMVNPPNDTSPLIDSSLKATTVTTVPLTDPGCGTDYSLQQSPSSTNLTTQQKQGRDRSKHNECKHERKTSPKTAIRNKNYDTKSPPKAKAALKRDRSENSCYKARAKRYVTRLENVNVRTFLPKTGAQVELHKVSYSEKTVMDTQAPTHSMISSESDISTETKDLPLRNCDSTTKISTRSNEEKDEATSITKEIQNPLTQGDPLTSTGESKETSTRTIHVSGSDMADPDFRRLPQACIEELQNAECSRSDTGNEHKHERSNKDNRRESLQISVGGSKRSQRFSTSRNHGKTFFNTKEHNENIHRSPRLKIGCKNIDDFTNSIRKAQHSPGSSGPPRNGKSALESIGRRNHEQEPRQRGGVWESKVRDKTLQTSNSQYRQSKGQTKISNELEESQTAVGDQCKSVQETEFTLTCTHKTHLECSEGDYSHGKSEGRDCSDSLVADDTITTVLAPSIPNASSNKWTTTTAESKEQDQIMEPDEVLTKDVPDKKNAAAISSRAREVIVGLGGVADLFRNQDLYLSKLKEVRRNFELSIEALKDNREVGKQDITDTTKDS